MRKKNLKKDTVKKIIIISVMAVLTPAMAVNGMQQKEQRKVHVAVNGSDESGDGTLASPYATVSIAAVEEPGSLIIVHGGEYSPIELGPDCSGSEDSPTVIRAEEGETAVVHAEDGIGISLTNVNNITIDGLETEGGTHGIQYMSTDDAGEQPGR